ncbi:hypothetical protein ENT_22360 [Enterococcus faecalis]|nr:hypothetical protein ENT_22360 [Enterococcus faecalis]
MNSVVNFRDIGGFPTKQGTSVKTGHFFGVGNSLMLHKRINRNW